MSTTIKELIFQVSKKLDSGQIDAVFHRFEEQSHEIKEAQEKMAEIVLAKQVNKDGEIFQNVGHSLRCLCVV